MAISKFTLLESLSNKEITEAIAETRKELFSLKFKKATRQTFKPNKIKMTKRSTIYVLVLLIGILTLSSCNRRTLSPINTATISNSTASEKKPYLLLISLDGFRWDYVEKFNPPHLSNFIKNGVKAASLIPSFPSKTFPNHYTIVTGMYPDN